MVSCVEEADSIAGSELQSVVEPTLPPLVLRKASEPKSILQQFIYPFKYTLVVVVFLTIILYMLAVTIAQGIGMLLMGFVMPSFMRLVYPSRLGQIHSSFLAGYRRWFIGKGGHSRSIRIDLLATQPPLLPSALGVPPLSPPETPPAPLRYSVHTVACLLDNYAYVLVDRSGPPPYPCALVDPCEPDAVVEALDAISEQDYAGEALDPVAILTTHHHWDHAAGNWALRKKYPRISVYGGIHDRVQGCTHRLCDGDTLPIGHLIVQAIHAPCHTRGSLLFKVDGPTPCFFGGDTLFCGGCGAAFEGTAAEMASNFVKIWRLCPPHTLVFPGHEYSLTILPGYLNGSSPWPESSTAYAKVCSSIWRANQLRNLFPPVPTVPLLLADELLVNTNFAELRTAVLNLISAYRQYEDATRASLLGSALEDYAPTPGSAAPSAASSRVRPSPPPSPPAPSGSSTSTNTCGPAPAVSPADVSPIEGEADASRAAAPPARPPVGANYWTTATMSVIPSQQLGQLEQVIATDPTASLAFIKQLRSDGAFAPTTIADGAPLNARVHHAPLPHVLGLDSWLERGPLVTTTETAQAFLLIAVPGSRDVHRATLRRAMTSGLLAPRKALTDHDFDSLEALVPPDHRGFITAEAFNSGLGVLKPLPPDPLAEESKASRFSRAVSRVSAAFSSKPPQRYEEADLSDDGTGPSAAGMYPRQMAI